MLADSSVHVCARVCDRMVCDRMELDAMGTLSFFPLHLRQAALKMLWATSQSSMKTTVSLLLLIDITEAWKSQMPSSI
jgi:hypothetical protein